MLPIPRPIRCPGTVLCAALSWVLATSPRVLAEPTGPSLVCESYADSSACMGRVPQCSYCHTSTFPAAWNAYGESVRSALGGEGFEVGLAGALSAVESQDSDGDGSSNIEEIYAGTLPGDPGSMPSSIGGGNAGLDPNPSYIIGAFDPAFAYKRASILYCGRSPSYAEMQPFRQPDAGAEQLRALLHERLTACLQSDYWRQEGLPRMADDRIRPIRNLGQDSEVMITIPINNLGGENRLRSVMGDYRFDYRLWVHALSEGRDARDLLLAQYFVVEDEDGNWSTTEELVAKTDPLATAGGQKLEKPYRAGMITTMWFITRNTMFTDLPRTTAAAAYRAYLGSDISKMQGLIPVAGEPDDIDDKGVDAPRCAVCHSTLDPLAYAFAPYNGFEFNQLTVFELLFLGQLNPPFGAYNAERPANRMPGWSAEEQQPVLLGRPVDSLREWAEVAAESDAFARNLANVFFEHAFHRQAEGDELNDFDALWQRLPEDGYSADALIHHLVDSDVFGAP